MTRVHHYLIIFFIAGTFLLAPTAFAKDDKPSISPSLYKKLKKTEKLIANKNYRGAQQSLLTIHNNVSKGGFEEATVLRSLSSVYALQENYRKATDALSKAVKLNVLASDQQQTALLNLGQLYMATEQYRKAVDVLENWLATNNKSDGQLYIMLAKAYAQLKQYTKAIPYVEKAIKNSKKPPESWYKMQLALYYETKQYSKAGQVLQKLIRFYPEKKQYWNQLASVYQQSNQYVKAATIKHLGYTKGILDSEREILDLANLFLYVDRPYKAATLLAKEIGNKRVKNTSKNWELLANAWTQARELDKALSALNTASRLNDKGLLYQRMGNLYIEQEQWQKAVEALNKALQKSGLKKPGNAYLMLGISYYELEKIAKARNAFNKAKAYKESQKAARQWLNYITDAQTTSQ